MSLLSTIEQAIKSCKVEQARINDGIQLYRDWLRGLTSQPKVVAEESEEADSAVADTSPGEKEEIELLEHALEKALRVRTSTEPKKDKNKLAVFHKEAGPSSVTHSKGSQSTIKSTSKSSSLDRESLKKPALGSRPSTSCNPGQSKTTNKTITQNRPSSSGGVKHYKATSASCSGDSVSALLSKNKTSRSNVLSGNDQAKAASVSTPSSNNRQAFSHIEESGVCNMVQQNGISSEHGKEFKWKSLRSKQNRLWDKAITQQRKSVPGRNHFVERLRATFPKDWPCGSPDETRALVCRLIHRGHELEQHCHMKEVLAKQTPKRAPEPGGRENRESLQLNAAELQSFGEQLKQEAELQELEKLRTRVALLQQEIYLEQALLDSLSPQLSSILPGPTCPNPSVLRDVYSLLGEGGERFPAIVLDSEPD